MTPDNVKSYVNAGHDVYIEKGAGEGSGILMRGRSNDSRVDRYIGRHCCGSTV